MIQVTLEAFGDMECEVWLLGSRANGSETAKSDWDFLVRCNASDLQTAVAIAEGLVERGIDVLLTTDKQSFWRRPWEGAASFSSWNWHECGTVANYVGQRFYRSDDDADLPASVGRIESKASKAHRLK